MTKSKCLRQVRRIALLLSTENFSLPHHSSTNRSTLLQLRQYWPFSKAQTRWIDSLALYHNFRAIFNCTPTHHRHRNTGTDYVTVTGRQTSSCSRKFLKHFFGASSLSESNSHPHLNLTRGKLLGKCPQDHGKLCLILGRFSQGDITMCSGT